MSIEPVGKTTGVTTGYKMPGAEDSLKKEVTPLDEINGKIKDVSNGIQQQRDLADGVLSSKKLFEEELKEKGGELKATQNSWRGRLIEWVGTNTVLGRFLLRFSVFKSVLDKENTLQLDMVKIVNRLINLNDETQQVTKILEDLNGTQTKLVKEKAVISTSENIYGLFKGRKEFLKLPVLDISSLEAKYKKSSDSFTDMIQPHDMPFPIMQGVRDGAPFFAIKAMNKHGPFGEVEGVQIFYQKNRFDPSTWLVGGATLIKVNGALIEEGRMNEAAYDRLQNLIDEVQSPPEIEFEDF